MISSNANSSQKPSPVPRGIHWFWWVVAIADCRRLCRRLLLQIVEVILDRPLVSARHLVLVERALGVALRRRRRFLIADGTLPLDADSLERDARHRAAGIDLAVQFRRREIVGQLRVAAVGQAARVRVRAIRRRCCPTNRSSWDTIVNRHRSMCQRRGRPGLCQGADNGRPTGIGRCNRRNSGTRPISNGWPGTFPPCSKRPASLAMALASSICAMIFSNSFAAAARDCAEPVCRRNEAAGPPHAGHARRRRKARPGRPPAKLRRAFAPPALRSFCRTAIGQSFLPAICAASSGCPNFNCSGRSLPSRSASF